MSDGPHSSLPLGRTWRKVAEFGDNETFNSSQVASAMGPALAADCRNELTPEFMRSLTGASNSLFQNHLQPQLEEVRANSTSGLANVVIDYITQLSATGQPVESLMETALVRAIEDWGARRARQIEEHYLRESTERHAHHVRSRLEEGLELIKPTISGLVRSVLQGGSKSNIRLQKQDGLDDGVTLP